MMETTPIKVVIQGFNTMNEAYEFCNWYSEQGEQDASIWFECRKEEGIIPSDTMNCKSINVGGPRANTVNMFIDPR